MGNAVRTMFTVGRLSVEQGVPEAFLGIPFLIDEDGQPDRWFFEYMMARRTGEWCPSASAEGAGRGRAAGAELGYLRNRGYQLDVFRRWLRNGLGIGYADVGTSDLAEFARALGSGTPRDSVGPLKPGSVIQYVGSATDLLRFGAHKGWRKPLGM